MIASSSKQFPALRVVLLLCCGSLAMALGLDAVTGSSQLAGQFVSQPLWQQIVQSLGGDVTRLPNHTLMAEVGVGKLFLICLVVSVLTLLSGSWLIAWRQKQSFRETVSIWVFAGWWWWMIPGVWEVLRVTALLMGWDNLSGLINSVVVFLFCIAWAGWLATFLYQMIHNTRSASPDSNQSPLLRSSMWTIGKMILVYTILFTIMNWQLYQGLLVPHGDSVMYEEHLWNITHNKGFRSYLDQGLFLGEHIQVVHLLLLPIYLLFPSHLTLELCESFALAVAAFPVFWITLRHSNSKILATIMVMTYLLYMPMHYLDIAIDLKTFRPISFGIPFMLFGIDQYERRRFGSMLLFFLLALSAKEEFAIMIAMFGLYIFIERMSFSPRSVALTTLFFSPRRFIVELFLAFTLSKTDRTYDEQISVEQRANKRSQLLGICLILAGTIYLLLAVTVVIPWFRDGVKVHYSAYFGELGHSPGELAVNSILHPLLFAKHFFTTRTMIYLLSLLVPLGFLPLFSLKRLMVAAPLFVILSLITLDGSSTDMLMPIHHFHAPLIPILLWAACAGLGNAQPQLNWMAQKIKYFFFFSNVSPHRVGLFALTSAFFIGLFMGFAPHSIGFWDTGSVKNWRRLYVPSKRAKMFEEVIKQIPPESNVASTDFVHPRFTHYQRSYDYSHFLRKVSQYKDKVPDDTDYIVIDTRHKYSDIHSAAELREIKHHPHQWQVLPDNTEGYYIILKRRKETHE